MGPENCSFHRDHSVYAFIKWEPMLHCNTGSHWLSTYTYCAIMTAAVIQHTLDPKIQAQCSFGYQPLWATPHLHAQAQRKALSRAFQFRPHGRATVCDMMPCLEAGHHTALLLCWPWAWRWGVAAQTASAGLRNGCMPPFPTYPNGPQAGHPIPVGSFLARRRLQFLAGAGPIPTAGSQRRATLVPTSRWRCWCLLVSRPRRFQNSVESPARFGDSSV